MGIHCTILSTFLKFSSISKFLKIDNFFFFLVVLGICLCVWAFSSCDEQGLLSNCGARASHCGGFSCCGAQLLGTWASEDVAWGLSSCGSWALEHEFNKSGTWA